MILEARRNGTTARERAGSALAVLLAVAALATACATPIGVERTSTQDAYRAFTQNVLAGGRPGPATEQYLRHRGLEERFEKEPEVVLAELRGHGEVLARDRLFSLAELWFAHGQASGRRDAFLAAVVYAYAFLLEARGNESATAIDPRTRLAVDLANLGIARALAQDRPLPGTDAPSGPSTEPDTNELDLSGRVLPLPFGSLDLAAPAPEQLLWGGYRLSRFVDMGEYRVRGLRNRYRQAGIGAPVAAEVTPVGDSPEAIVARKRVPARIKVPVTVFVRLEDVVAGIATGRLRGRIEVYAADEVSAVEVAGWRLPLESEPSATLAYTLEGAPVWDTEIAGFLSAQRALFPGGLAMLHPYRPGRAPVVFIHGTASSSARWANMINELQNDPVLRARVQFWFFTYNTSNPILLSASQLRQALEEVVKEIDPEGRDSALRRMVLVGHSQGGLLARLIVTSSGTRFWDNVSGRPFDEVSMAPDTRALMRSAMFFDPAPSVTRVIFIATPHRGSFRVTGLVLDLVRRLVTLPVTLVRGVQDLVTKNPDLETTLAREGVPTAVDNMLPGHPFVRSLSTSPIAPGVQVNSIVAVEGTGPLAGRTDGVVRYDSAHLEIGTEVIVQSSHSVQSNPEAILEVQRILRAHVAGE